MANFAPDHPPMIDKIFTYPPSSDPVTTQIRYVDTKTDHFPLSIHFESHRKYEISKKGPNGKSDKSKSQK
jgi:hypothetical protein